MELRRTLWDELEHMAPGVNQPWLITGDFNSLLSPEDRQAGAPVTPADTQEFTDCVRNHGTDRTSSKIDRAFGNSEWLMYWGHISTEYGCPFISGHCPMIIPI
ncbi:hypothetical protein P3S68_004145 [Capsicum galapagoense]